ncbi:helix-turn-helix domain-containing protein [Sorlinia euscelidii]
MPIYKMYVEKEDRQNGGAYLKSLRETAGIAIRDVADALRLNRVYLYSIERGDAPLRPEYLPKVASLYGVDLAEMSKRYLRYRDPLIYAFIFGDEGDPGLREMRQEFVEGEKSNRL